MSGAEAKENLTGGVAANQETSLCFSISDVQGCPARCGGVSLLWYGANLRIAQGILQLEVSRWPWNCGLDRL